MPSRRSKPGRKRATTRPQQLGIALRGLLIVLGSLGMILFGAYLIGLDKQVRDRFAGVRWALPAQVFAAPLELYTGLDFSAATLKRELLRIGYRESPRLDGPGTFRTGSGEISLQTRPFLFWDGAQPEMQIKVYFAGAQIREIRDMGSNQNREIVRLDPLLIGSIYPQHGEDRVLVRLDEVPGLLPQGLMAVEDREFYDHAGVSLKGILRASWANLRAGRVVQGGSTLTQQLVKNFFLTSRQSLSRKINEAFMALLLELHFDKDEILEAYLNEVHLGQDGSRAVHGFGLGAQFYFNKPLSELKPHETALLVGLVKGPSYYNPRRNPERALARRDLVLRIFADDGLISEADYQQAIATPLQLAGSQQTGVERHPAFVDLVKRQLKGQYAEADLTNEGLRIFTTLDPRAQEALEDRIAGTLPQIEKARKIKPDTLQAAGVITSVDGGEVLAVVGGRDVRFPGFNRALDAQRSIGSLAKPFVYLTALMRPEQFSLHSILPDEEVALSMPHGPVWTPQNYDKQLHGPQPLYVALAQSYNLPTVHVGLQVGERAVRDTMRAAGYTGQTPPLPSIFLGAVDASPVEVAQMYATLAANGYQAPLTAIREVLTKEGQPLNRYPLKVTRALPEAPVYLINWALEQVMLFGTGRSAYSTLPASVVLAGKTGTTDEYRDAWFAGFGADRVAVIWVGRDDNQPINLSGSSAALPIWAGVMRDIQVRSLDQTPPAGVEMVLVDPDSGLRADEGCGAQLAVPYLAGYAPTTFAPCAKGATRSPLEWLKGIFD
jgi:penicillin-binding protein 1B